jgi:trigger factor
VQHRIHARIRSAVLDAVLAVTAFSVPKALVEKEIQILRDRAKENLEMRGLRLDDIEPINSEWFSVEAERRARSGLIFADIGRREQLNPSMDQVMVLLNNFALSYEDPEQMMEWCLDKPERMMPFVGMATEANVVEWVLKNAQVKDTPITFDELMNDAVA